MTDIAKTLLADKIQVNWSRLGVQKWAGVKGGWQITENSPLQICQSGKEKGTGVRDHCAFKGERRNQWESENQIADHDKFFWTYDNPFGNKPV